MNTILYFSCRIVTNFAAEKKDCRYMAFIICEDVMPEKLDPSARSIAI